VSELPLDRDGHDVSETERRELLEMHEVRRRVERGAIANRSLQRASLAMAPASVI
jgi:hypothetical protein